MSVQLKESMKKIENIRNISVIAHVDHGKTTLVDSLLSLAGIISCDSAGKKRTMDSDIQEKERGITIKSAAISLLFNNKYLVNLIDSPGHVDFSSEVTAALRVSDGALVVVDCIEGVCVQTETVLRQAIQERVKPVLFLNKLDRIFLEKQLSVYESYQILRNSIESVNVIYETYKTEIKMDDISPELGNVGFGSALHSWGFTLKNFALFYTNLYGLKISKMMEKLWGNNYFDTKLKKWVELNQNNMNHNIDHKRYLHGFSDLILKPIKILTDAIMNEKKEIYEPIINMLGLKISKNEINKILSNQTKKNKNLLKLIMRKWLPCGDALLEIIVNHLPSPNIAQPYRIPILYSGPLETNEAKSILNCDPLGSLSIYISKMIPMNDRFIAFGRIFSGTIKVGQQIRILGPNFDNNNDNNNDLNICKVQNLLTMMGTKAIGIEYGSAGNLCGIVGIDSYLTKSGTITDNNDIYPFKTMKFSVAAVVKIAINCCKSSDLPKLVEGLKKLSKSDPLIKITQSNQNEHIIAGSGELHLETCIRDLKEKFMNNAPLKISNPIVSFRESVKTNININSKYPNISCGKTPNKLNRLYMKCESINDKNLINGLENNSIQLINDKKLFSNLFKNQFKDYYKNTNINPLKIWSFGCLPDSKANLLVDQTKGLTLYSDVRSNIINAFKSYTLKGILCEENIYGVRYNLIDCKLHPDSVHRRQIPIAAKKCFSASQLSSNPCLLEPMYMIDITVPTNKKNGVFNTLSMYRAEIDEINDKINIPLTSIHAFIPILETFSSSNNHKSFNEVLREKTNGTAFIQMKFSHWQLINGNPLINNGNHANKIMMNVRKRKGLKLEIPNFYDYYDKI